MTVSETCVFVIDDDPDIRETIQAVLEMYGYGVCTAHDGQQALDGLRGGLKPRLILLDIMMPGMNGPQFLALQRVDPALANIPVVFMSGDSRVNERAATLGAEALRKPIELDELLALAGRFCGPPPKA